MNIISKISDKMLMPEKELLVFSSTAPRRYKKYTINKRNSTEKRLIAHPSKEVKFLQRLIVDELKDILPIHSCATAYMPNRGIKLNATIHKNNNYLLKMDFKNFFLTITPDIFISELNKIGIDVLDRDAQFLSGMLFWKLRRNSPLRLSIGAPSSPYISNVIMYSFDTIISDICVNMGVTYTRYADDLTFTSNVQGVLFNIPLLVKRTLRECYGSKIRVNSNKTIYSSKAFNRHITGITLTNDGNISVGRQKKRYISSLIHKYKLGLLSEAEVVNLKGLISFVSDIEPIFVGRMINKYGYETMSDLSPKKFLASK